MTRSELRLRFAARLAQAGVAFGQGTHSAESDAAALVDGYFAGTDVADQDAVPESAQAELDAMLARRVSERLPAAHLTGVGWFAGETWHVPPGVMIPRSPIAEVLRAGVAPWMKHEPQAILDLCCGNGCLGLVAARVFDEARVDLADIDPAALAAAERNLAARPEMAERVGIVQGDLFAGVDRQRYDLVICNPPYVPTAALANLPAEFGHEPSLGLDGGKDGLDLWRRIIKGLDAHLRPGALLLGEAGAESATFDAAFPHLGAIWPDLEHAERQDDGTFGVFVAERA